MGQCLVEEFKTDRGPCQGIPYWNDTSGPISSLSGPIPDATDPSQDRRHAAPDRIDGSGPPEGWITCLTFCGRVRANCSQSAPRCSDSDSWYLSESETSENRHLNLSIQRNLQRTLTQRRTALDAWIRLVPLHQLRRIERQSPRSTDHCCAASATYAKPHTWSVVIVLVTILEYLAIGTDPPAALSRPDRQCAAQRRCAQAQPAGAGHAGHSPADRRHQCGPALFQRHGRRGHHLRPAPADV